MPTDDDNEGFLTRWSRRKRSEDGPGLRKSPEPAPVEADEPSIVAGRMITEPELLQPEVLNPEVHQVDPDTGELSQTRNLEPQPCEPEENSVSSEQDIKALEETDFESLDFDSDYTRFMQAGVPELIRRKALRKLWLSNPILANVDGLNDYDEDFTDAKLAVENLQTAFKAQHGYMSEEEVAAQERLGREEEYDTEQDADEETREVAEATDNEPERSHEDDPASEDMEVLSTAPGDEDDDELDDDGDSDWA